MEAKLEALKKQKEEIEKARKVAEEQIKAMQINQEHEVAILL